MSPDYPTNPAAPLTDYSTATAGLARDCDRLTTLLARKDWVGAYLILDSLKARLGQVEEWLDSQPGQDRIPVLKERIV